MVATASNVAIAAFLLVIGSMALAFVLQDTKEYFVMKVRTIFN